MAESEYRECEISPKGRRRQKVASLKYVNRNMCEHSIP